MLKAVCDFLAFDRRFRGLSLSLKPGEGLPACELVPDHLNEVVMNLLQACAEDEPRRFERVEVQTALQGGAVCVRIAGAQGGLADWFGAPRFAPTRRRIAEMGAQARAVEGAIELTLPTSHTE